MPRQHSSPLSPHGTTSPVTGLMILISIWGLGMPTVDDLRSKESPGGVYVTPPVDSVCPKVIATSAFIRSLTRSITATGTGAPPLKTTFNVVGLYCSNSGCWSMAISMVGTAKIYSQFSCLMTCSVLSGSKASKGCSVILPTIVPAAMPAPAIWKNGRGIQ